MSDSKNYSRYVQPLVQNALSEARVVAILGPRQSGKSTLVKMIAESGYQGKYVTLDDDVSRVAALNDPAGFLADSPTPLIIDEIQRAPELMLAIKRRVDNDNLPGQYLLTGSANLLSLASIPDALPGRVDYLNLWPLSQGEIAGSKESFLENIFAGDIPNIVGAAAGRTAYADRVLAGGYPEALVRSNATRSRFLSGLARSSIRFTSENIWDGNENTTRLALEAIANQSAGLLNYSSLARKTGGSDKTMRAHVQALEQMFLVRRHRPWFTNSGKRLTKLSKAYVSDSGMLCALLGINKERLIQDANLAGSVFETFAVMELVKQAAWEPNEISILHYRDSHQVEVDIVLERADGTVVAIEVKAGATVTQSDFRGIRSMQQIVGKRFAAGIVLYLGADTVPFGDNTYALPLQGLWASE